MLDRLLRAFRKPSVDDSAAQLLLAFWSNMSVGVGTDDGWFAPKGSLAALDPLVSQVRPLRGGRKDQSSGRPLDFLAPSAWHACAYLTLMDFFGRASKEPFGQVDDTLVSTFYRQRLIYRGQAHAWPMLPTAWRNDNPSVSEWRRRVFHELLSRRANPDRDPILELVGHIQRQEHSDSVAQHYGLPTNLVDFTFNPLIACAFACGRSEGVFSPPATSTAPRNCAVVYFVPLGNEVVRPVVRATLPPVTVDRLYRQAGLFLTFGDRRSYDEAQLRSEIGAHPACHQVRRLFFPRSYPDAQEYAGLQSLVGELETPSSSVEELVSVVRRLEPASVAESASEAADRAERQIARRSEWDHVVRLITDDEMLLVFRRLEYYVRVAAMLEMNREPRLNPVVLAALSDSITPSIFAFRGVLNHITRRSKPRDDGDPSSLTRIRWFTDRVIEAREAVGVTDSESQAVKRFGAFRSRLDEMLNLDDS